MLIQNATKEVHKARQQHEQELFERNKLRRLVESIDVVIADCEGLHLQGFKHVSPDLVGQASGIYDTARGTIEEVGDTDAVQAVEDASKRRQERITDLMDALWTVQEVAFDHMLPWRTELPEDVELPGTPESWRYDSAA